MKNSTAKKIGQALKSKHDVRQQIIDRVVDKPGAPKVNPNAPKRKHPYAEGTPGFNRAKLGLTMTAIQASINEPNAVVTVMLDENDQPTGETSTVMVKPDRSVRMERRAHFEARGLLGPFANAAERRKVRRRNNRAAACNVAVKKNRAAKKPATEAVAKKGAK